MKKNEFSIHDIPITMVFSDKRKTVGVEVKNTGKVVVRAPTSVSIDRVKTIVSKKENWILRKLEVVKAQQLKENKFDICGIKLPYMGRIYSVVSPSTREGLYRGQIHFPATNNMKQQRMNWFKQRAKKILSKDCSEAFTLLGFERESFRIMELGSRWGSCSYDGTINLNWKLITLPKNLRNYVIVHELAHIEVHDHSEKFWKHLGELLPSFEELRDKLLSEGLRLQMTLPD